MANEFRIKNGFFSEGDSQVTGSLTVTGGMTGSFSGSLSAPGSSGQLIFNSAGVLEGASSLSYKSSGRLGINVPSPLARLNISGSSSDTLLKLDSDLNSNLLFVSGSGNIGINTNTPEYALDINGEARVASSLVFKYIGSNWFRHTIGAGYYIIQNLLDSSYSLTIDSTNHIGINTIGQTAQLEVKGTGTTSDTETLRITDSNNSPIIVAQDGGNVGIGTTPNSFFKLHLSGSNNLNFGGTTIGNNGTFSLQHGTSDNPSGNPQYTALGGIFFENTQSGYYQNDIVFKTTTPTTSPPFININDDLLWERFRISQNGITIEPDQPAGSNTTRLMFGGINNRIQYDANVYQMDFVVNNTTLLNFQYGGGSSYDAIFNTDLFVNGSTNITSTGTTSATTGFEVRNGNNNPTLVVQDDKKVAINRTGNPYSPPYEGLAWYDLHVSGTAAANNIIVGNTIGIQPAVNPVYGPPVMLFNFTSSEAGYANVDFRIDTWPQLITMPYFNTPTVFTVKYDSKVGIGVGNTQPTAQLHIKSAGSSSATQAFRVETSGSLEVFKILDDGSATQGFNNTASGNYSHAEGISTKTGIVGAYRCLFSGPPPNPITGSIFTLDPSYGVSTSSFTAGNQLQIYNPSNTQTWSSTISSVSFDGIATKVLVNTPSLYFIGGIIADIDTSLRGDAVIPARAAHAEGSYTKAYGFNSHAEGLGSEAIGLGSHAEGNDTTARGDGSHAEGYKTITTGDYSHTEGYLTTSSGDYSHAEGSDTKAIGNYSHAEGEITEAVGSYSHAEGSDTQAIGNYSHAEGSRTIASGSYSHAEGSTARALGSYSHAEGISSYSYGDYSHAEGFFTKTGIAGAYEANPIFDGIFTLSSTYGDVSSNFGIGNDLYVYNLVENKSSVLKITNSYFDSTNTIVEVSDTSYNSFVAYIIDLNYPNGDKIIDSRYSHAEGYGTLTIGNGSHAEGENTIAVDWYQHVQGIGNIPVNGRGAFIVGNGNAFGTRSNLIFASGSTVQVTGSLDVKGTITNNGTNIQALSIAYAIALG